MPEYRSRTTTHGRNMAGARALWRATGMGDDDFDKPIIAVANSFTQFVPGHVHLKDMGQLVAREIEAAGGDPDDLFSEDNMADINAALKDKRLDQSSVNVEGADAGMYESDAGMGVEEMIGNDQEREQKASGKKDPE